MAQLEKLRNVLIDLVGDGSLLTIQPGGNYGDTLIYKGAQKLFRENNINWVPFKKGQNRDDSPPPFKFDGPREYYNCFRRIIRELEYAKRRSISDISAIYIHGGGNFNDFYGSGIRSYQVACRYFDVPIIIGPQSCHFSVTDPDSIFKGIDNETHFFCREKYSYEIISNISTGKNVEVYIEDDTALYLDIEDLPAHTFAEDFSLLAFRQDKESADMLIKDSIEPPVRVRDISDLEPDLGSFVNTGAKSSHIYTDRLHVAILAVLLDKPVQFYENVYHKNRGVYENSLEDNMNVKFSYKEDS